ncbi:Pro-Pol polyprotein [Thelohanellus kitauei]|uniref:Pro-Pol polyprotein n=1 Tax=Thelohanellus kitauei TaxID=669202 RepID=A0A0C2IJQ7_THEKT|nr:Pro-Pol polyprotein [Thelohanellus kitauei]
MKTITSLYHPQSNGLVERNNRTIVKMLSKCIVNRDGWDNSLQKVIMAYRSSLHKSMSMTPYYVLFGREMKLPVDRLIPTIVKSWSNIHEYALNQRFLLTTPQRLSGKDLKPLKNDYYVMLKLPSSNKLQEIWTGPHKIVKKIGDVSYQIEINGKLITQRYNQLKPYIERASYLRSGEVLSHVHIVRANS